MSDGYDYDRLHEQFDMSTTGTQTIDAGDVSNDTFHHDVLPYFVGMVSVSGHGVTDIDWTVKEITTAPISDDV